MGRQTALWQTVIRQRPIVGEVLESPEVGLEAVAPLEVDVEGDEVARRHSQVLGRGEVDVRDEPLRVLLLRRGAEPREEALDAPSPVPPGDGGGDLVPDRVGEHGLVSRAPADRAPHAPLDVPRAPAIIEERDVLLPRQPDEDTDAMRSCRVE